MPGRPYFDMATINGVNFYAVTVDPNGVLSAPIGSYATLKTAPMIWVNADGATTWNLVYPVALPPGMFTSDLLWGNGEVGSTTTTRYLTPGYDDVLAPVVDGIVQFRVTQPGTLRNLRIRHNAPAGNGNLIVYTVRVNGVPTALSVSIASTATDGSNLVNTVVVAAGDLIDIEVTKALSVGVSPSFVSAILEVS